MASLKEVKTRISTVNSTRKITSAMKMVASSKLHRAQMDIERMRPYEAALDRMMSTFVSNMSDELSSPFAIKREVKRVALVVFTSNSSLCGGFNGNVIKMVQKTVDSYRKSNTDIVRVYAIGRKGAEAVRKLGFEVENDYASLLDHPSYDVARGVAQELMALYTSGEVDEVKMIYHHFKSSDTQQLTQETFLPISLQQEGKVEKSSGPSLNYIIEPSVEEVVAALIPKTLNLRVYTALLDSLASEHAARVIAMQVATDNADELLRELKLTYNKTRQQAITTELLDIVGGSMQ